MTCGVFKFWVDMEIESIVRKQGIMSVCTVDKQEFSNLRELPVLWLMFTLLHTLTLWLVSLVSFLAV